MLQFTNSTPFKGSILLLPDADGIDSLYTIVKATFALKPSVAVADEQVAVTATALHYGDPASSSIRVPSDISLMKPGTDVLLLGHAYAPGGRATEMDVSLSVGPLSRTVRVFGDRAWRTTLGYAMTRPAPFETMPLVWERAFGGTDQSGKELKAETRNPVGLGFAAPPKSDPPEEWWLPNLEDPSELISSPTETPPPACFAPVAPHWEPRRSHAGTYDDRWQNERAPYLPEDFDSRFFQLAPPGLVSEGHLQGGELVEIGGATPSGRLRFRLPVIDLEITYVLDAVAQPQPAVLDTVIIEPDMDRLQLVWRSVLQCDKKALRVSEVRAALGTLHE